MEPFVERLVDEIDELTTKMIAGYKYSDSIDSKDVMLVEQLSAMELYREILVKRLKDNGVEEQRDGLFYKTKKEK